MPDRAVVIAGAPFARGPHRRRQIACALAAVQGAYYLGTGVWPLLDSESFQRVTGPKTDVWLVKTVGLLVGVIGGVLLGAAAQRTVSRETRWLAGASAAGLAAVDVVYALGGRISPIYLADAAVEVVLSAAWLAQSDVHGTERPPVPEAL